MSPQRQWFPLFFVQRLGRLFSSLPSPPRWTTSSSILGPGVAVAPRSIQTIRAQTLPQPQPWGSFMTSGGM